MPVAAGSGPPATVVAAGSGARCAGGHRPPGIGRLFYRPAVVTPGPALRAVVVPRPGGRVALGGAVVAVAPVLGLRPGALAAAPGAGGSDRGGPGRARRAAAGGVRRQAAGRRDGAP